jgi:hypothetical protein
MDLTGLERKVSEIQHTVERISGLLASPQSQVSTQDA